MSDPRIDALNKSLNEDLDSQFKVEDDVADDADVAETTPPVVELPSESEAAAEATKSMTYAERVQKNIETGHDRIKLTQALLGEHGEYLSVGVIDEIIKDAESTAKEKILKPGYDPSKYADIIKTDAEILAKRVVANKKAAKIEVEQDNKVDYMNAIEEFGINNISKKDDALKWYAEARGVPLELVQQESVVNKMHIYKAYTANKVPQTKQEVYSKTYNEVIEYLNGKR